MKHVKARVISPDEPIEGNAHVDAGLPVDDVVDAAIHDEEGEEHVACVTMCAYDDELEAFGIALLPEEALEPHGHVVRIDEEGLVDDREATACRDRVVEHGIERAPVVRIEAQVDVIPKHRREVSASLVRRQNDRVARATCSIHLPSPLLVRALLLCLRADLLVLYNFRGMSRVPYPRTG